KIEILWGDDQRDPKQGVAIAQQFVSAGVAGVIGHFHSSVSIPASTVYHEGGLVQITPASTNPQYTERGLWNVFRVCGRDDQQGKVAADFVVQKLKAKRVAVLHDKTTYGQGLADEFAKAIKAQKVTPVSYGGVTQGDKDYTAVLTALKGKDPQVLFFGGIYPEATLLSKQMRALGLKAAFVSGDGVWTEEYIKIAGPAAEGAYITFTPDQKRIKEAQSVIRRHQEKYGRDVGAYTIYSYVAATIPEAGRPHPEDELADGAGADRVRPQGGREGVALRGLAGQEREVRRAALKGAPTGGSAGQAGGDLLTWSLAGPNSLVLLAFLATGRDNNPRKSGERRGGGEGKPIAQQGVLEVKP
ncbi:MAG: branched-chain amino acid ABC transporter substrate-binding protein, partial [Deltaproteobacteria bacterium]|nr:branched-chain amino acid ABC transporter substrate-binding protein [Deltaproteobacteria bacterium]